VSVVIDGYPSARALLGASCATLDEMAPFESSGADDSGR
jgi:hypothetical protein